MGWKKILEWYKYCELKKVNFIVDFCRRMRYDISRDGNTGSYSVKENRICALSSVGRAVDS